MSLLDTPAAGRGIKCYKACQFCEFWSPDSDKSLLISVSIDAGNGMLAIQTERRDEIPTDLIMVTAKSVLARFCAFTATYRPATETKNDDRET